MKQHPKLEENREVKNAKTFRLHPDDIEELAKQISKGTGGEFNKALQSGNSGQPASKM